MRADPSSLAVWGVVLRSLACWDCGFESRRGHGCLSLMIVVCCQVEVSASGWSLVQMSPTECGVSECDHEFSTMRRPWPTGGCCAMVKKKNENEAFWLFMKFSCDFHIFNYKNIGSSLVKFWRAFTASPFSWNNIVTSYEVLKVVFVRISVSFGKTCIDDPGFRGVRCLQLQDSRRRLLYCFEDGGRRFFRNVGTYFSTFTAPYPRRLESSWKYFPKKKKHPAKAVKERTVFRS